MIRAGVRTNSMIGRTKDYGAFSVGISQVQETVHYIEQFEHHRRQPSQEEYLAFLKKHGAHFDEKYLWD
jgi:putative transposase